MTSRDAFDKLYKSARTSRDEVCHVLGITKQALSQYELGDARPTDKRMQLWAAALGLETPRLRHLLNEQWRATRTRAAIIQNGAWIATTEEPGGPVIVMDEELLADPREGMPITVVDPRTLRCSGIPEFSYRQQGS